jgi:hypothetical protein
MKPVNRIALALALGVAVRSPPPCRPSKCPPQVSRVGAPHLCTWPTAGNMNTVLPAVLLGYTGMLTAAINPD